MKLFRVLSVFSFGKERALFAEREFKIRKCRK